MSKLNKFKSLLLDQNLDAILISSPANLYYASGFICLSPLEREAYVLITKQQTYLITSPLYAGDNSLSLEISLQKTKNSSHEKIITELLKRHAIKTIGFEDHSLSVAEYNQMQTSGIKFLPLHARSVRIQKSPEEISLIEKACEIGDDAFSFILEKIKPGISEKEIASEMEIYIRRKNAVLSFPSIIAFGKNAAIPHHVTSSQKIAKNNFLLLDFGVKVNEYCSDMTRTIYVGKPSNEEKNMYATVLESQKRAIEYIQSSWDGDRSSTLRLRPEGLNDSEAMAPPRWTQAADVDKIARGYIKSQGFPDFPHTLGHGIGLMVHEAPSLSAYSKDELKPGMVFSVEPGIYLHDKTGVRIEDLMVMEEKNSRVLTQTPKELITL